MTKKKKKGGPKDQLKSDSEAFPVREWHQTSLETCGFSSPCFGNQSPFILDLHMDNNIEKE